MKKTIDETINELNSLETKDIECFINENFSKLSFKDIKNILQSNPDLNLKKDAFLFFILKHNENHEIYPNINALLNFKEDLDFKFEKLAKYQISLLNKYNQYEELKSLQENSIISRLTHLCFLNEKQSESIINIELEKNPMYVFNVKSWKDIKTSEWIKNNLNNPIEALNKNSFYINGLGKLSRESFYTKLYDSFLLSTKKSQVKILELAPIDFWKFSMDKNPVIIIDLLQSQTSFNISDKNNTTLICNNLQKIMHKKYFINIKDCNYIRSKFSNVLNKNLILKTENESEELSIFQYGKEYELKVLLPFYKQKNLTKEEKENFLDAVFFFLQIQYDNINVKLINLSNKERELFKNWSVQSFLMAEQNMLDKHFEKNITNFSKSELNEIQNIYLFSDLKKSVDNKTNPTRKLKL